MRTARPCGPVGSVPRRWTPTLPAPCRRSSTRRPRPSQRTAPTSSVSAVPGWPVSPPRSPPNSACPLSTVSPPRWRWPRRWWPRPEHQQGRCVRRGTGQPAQPLAVVHITGTRPVTEVDLASRALGGSVVAASDESFGFKERLIDPGEPAFVPGTYDLRGEVVDGWETRRHADGDWAIVRLGVGGRLRTIDVDTRFFAGNHPTGCRIDACVLDPVADPTSAAVRWTTVVASGALKSDSHNVFAVEDPRRYTHIRLHLESDGGVARLRAYGDVVPDPALWAGVTVEVSGVEQGGRVEWSSDSFYSDAYSL